MFRHFVPPLLIATALGLPIILAAVVAVAFLPEYLAFVLIVALVLGHGYATRRNEKGHT
jgi:hypothetical protein